MNGQSFPLHGSLLSLVCGCALLTGCGAEGADDVSTGQVTQSGPTVTAGAGSAAPSPAGASPSGAAVPTQTTPALPNTAPTATPSTPSTPTTATPPPEMLPSGATPPATQPAASPGDPAGAPAPTASEPTTPAGPDDGDPSKPIAAIDEVPCKAGGGGFGLGGANFKVDDRDLILSYPCDKHEGAPVTFILNLHGTTPVSAHFYQEGYFSAAKYATSHNLIVATPSSVVEQWGNGDNGEDLPYLMHIIDFVYEKLGSKFDIRSMWVGGHSWGAFYTSTFGCRPELADKVDGLIIMSGSPTVPACSASMSVINTNAEDDIGPPLEQGSLPMQHGCGAAMMSMLGNNTQTLWPDCDAGYVHTNYLMLGKGHIDSIDDVVVKDIVDRIQAVRP